MRRDPHQLGLAESRWSLARLLSVWDWLALSSLGGLSRLLDRLQIGYLRGRLYYHSPDPDYRAKLHWVELARQRAQSNPERFVFLYLDELTYYRQPSLGYDYEASGLAQPLARYSYHHNTAYRVVAALNVQDGQVHYRQASLIGLAQLKAFYVQLAAAYPGAETIYVAQDNWPVHFHVDVLAQLEAQTWPFPYHRAPNWPSEPSPETVRKELPIQLLGLPTYASWCNPIEKLWRWLKQAVLHLHRMSDQWAELKQRVAAFLDQFSQGSLDLLRYVGLLPD